MPKDCSCKNKNDVKNVQTIIATAKAKANKKMATFEGREHLVLPVVAIVEGVLNGYYIPKEEFVRYESMWEGVPIPVTHPSDKAGNFLSANTKETLEKFNIGRFHNVQVKDNKLCGEIWIDIALARKKGYGNVVDHLKGGKVMEVSTGFYASSEHFEEEKEFNGVKYNGIHRNIEPDHLALLPDEIGACSVNDGCGANQIFNTKGVRNMDKEEMIKAILADEALGFTEDNLEMLRSMPEAALGRLLKKDDAAMADGGKEDESTNADGEEDKKTNADGEEDKTASANADKEFMKSLSPNMRKFIESGMRRMSQQKQQLVVKLKAEKKCLLTESQLNSMDVDSLEALDKSFSDTNYSLNGNGAKPKGKVKPLTVKKIEIGKPAKAA